MQEKDAEAALRGNGPIVSSLSNVGWIAIFAADLDTAELELWTGQKGWPYGRNLEFSCIDPRIA